MKYRWMLAALLAAPLLAPGAAGAQTSRPTPAPPSILGTWIARSRPKELKGKEQVHEIVIRPDSSASYGREIVRWRLQPASGEVLLALGGEWVAYKLKVKGDQLTLSGGDLNEPVTLRRVGPATPRPANVQVPPDPDTEE